MDFKLFGFGPFQWLVNSSLTWLGQSTQEVGPVELYGLRVFIFFTSCRPGLCGLWK